MTTKPKQQIRCDVYTRKSTDENLDLDFNSLDAQREAGEAYIKSQQHEGWVCVDEQYNDGGFSGGNVDRPAFQQLMQDVNDGKVTAAEHEPYIPLCQSVLRRGERDANVARFSTC